LPDILGATAIRGTKAPGRYILVVWEHVEDDPRTITPVTAYEVPPPGRRKQ
jgi:hypothetical protein